MHTENQTALYEWHLNRQAKMVNFAGYEMPVQYQEGVLKEHLWTRENAGLFDVSHMGQIIVSGKEREEHLENIFPVDLEKLSIFGQSYTLLLNPAAGIVDDLMLAKREDDCLLVVNASRKKIDLDCLREYKKN